MNEKSRRIIKLLAGSYLLYLGIALLAGIIQTQPNELVVMIGVSLFFIAVGGMVVYTPARHFLRAAKSASEKSKKKAEQKEEQAQQTAAVENTQTGTATAVTEATVAAKSADKGKIRTPSPQPGAPEKTAELHKFDMGENVEMGSGNIFKKPAPAEKSEEKEETTPSGESGENGNSEPSSERSKNGKLKPSGERSKSGKLTPSGKSGENGNPELSGESGKSENPEPSNERSKSGKSKPSGKPCESGKPEYSGKSRKNGNPEPSGESGENGNSEPFGKLGKSGNPKTWNVTDKNGAPETKGTGGRKESEGLDEYGQSVKRKNVAVDTGKPDTENRAKDGANHRFDTKELELDTRREGKNIRKFDTREMNARIRKFDTREMAKFDTVELDDALVEELARQSGEHDRVAEIIDISARTAGKKDKKEEV